MFTINIIFSQYKVSWSFKQSFEITTNAFEKNIVPTNHYNAPSMVFTNISCSYTGISFLSGASPIYLFQINGLWLAQLDCVQLTILIYWQV